jgi:hypothetical protein
MGAPRLGQILAAMILCGGCAAMNYLAEEYGYDLPHGSITTSAGDFNVWTNKKGKTAILTQRGLGAAIAEASVRGVTLGAADMSPAARQHADAAEEVLKRVGHECRRIKTDQIERISYEHEYACAGGYTVTRVDIANASAGR